MYRKLNIIQRIAFKGWLKHKETRPHFLSQNDHKYFDGLNALWILHNFEVAVNEFFYDNANGKSLFDRFITLH